MGLYTVPTDRSLHHADVKRYIFSNEVFLLSWYTLRGVNRNRSLSKKNWKKMIETKL